MVVEESSFHESSNDDPLDECKVFVTRIPVAFDDESVKRLLEERLGEHSVVEVALKHNEETNEHRGFAFVTLAASDLKHRAIELGTVRGGAKPRSTKKSTLYIQPVVRCTSDKNSMQQLCYLWAKFRCPYGNECKFLHQGQGGCLEEKNSSKDDGKAQKCFAFKKGKCKLGEACPYSHDFTVEKIVKDRDPSEKDCINWKTKGKCRKKDKCPYKHDEEVRLAALAKMEKKKADKKKTQQPLSVRVYGLNYETTEEDIREHFRHCGPIVEVTFPRFQDSGRSKGYCGILFQSPKAVAKAVELDGGDLHGRWLRVQAGKMFLKQWEAHHDTGSGKRGIEGTQDETFEEPLVGEFGQKVKRRKKHGYKD